jgi:colanic acid/amylovoran biosynthesis glycosyltransferase
MLGKRIVPASTRNSTEQANPSGPADFDIRSEAEPKVRTDSLRIAFFVGSFPAVSETFIVDQAAGLLQRKHNVVIFALHPGDSTVLQPKVATFRLMERVQVVSVPTALGRRLARLASAFALCLRYKPRVFRRLAKQALDSSQGSLSQRLRRVVQVFYFAPYFVRQPSFDVIHCHFAQVGVFAESLRRAGVISGPLITTVHGVDVTAHARYHGTQVFTPLFRNSDAFTCSSTYMARVLEKCGCPPTKIVRFKLGIELAAFPARPPLQRSSNFRVLTVARLTEKKGHKYSIAAMAKLRLKYPDLQYFVVGDGTLREELERQIQELNLGSHVSLLGWKTGENLRQLYNEADVFLLSSVRSSQGDTEGQGLVLQEAQAIGLPIVCTDHNGFSEGIVPDVTGYLVPEYDSDAIAEKLDKVLQNPDFRRSAAVAGRQFVEAEYDLERRNDCLVTLYNIIRTGAGLPDRL